MFNSTTQKTSINNPANGIIQRSNEKSFFVNLQNGSSLCDKLFCNEPKYHNKSVLVLQVMLMNQQYMLCELIFKDEI